MHLLLRSSFFRLAEGDEKKFQLSHFSTMCFLCISLYWTRPCKRERKINSISVESVQENHMIFACWVGIEVIMVMKRND